MAESAMISLDLPATHRFLSVLSASIGEMLKRADDQRPAQENQIYELQLAAQEVAANIVDHAYADTGGRIAVQLSYDAADHQISIIFTDRGVVYKEKGAPALPSLEDSASGGMGLFLVMSLVDDLSYERRDETNVWQITKRLA